MQNKLLILFGKIPKERIDWENYIAVENIQAIAEGELINPFTIEATRVLFNRHCFTKPDI